jgi:hypothetical protein
VTQQLSGLISLRWTCCLIYVAIVVCWLAHFTCIKSENLIEFDVSWCLFQIMKLEIWAQNAHSCTEKQNIYNTHTHVNVCMLHIHIYIKLMFFLTWCPCHIFHQDVNSCLLSCIFTLTLITEQTWHIHKQSGLNLLSMSLNDLSHSYPLMKICFYFLLIFFFWREKE